jgi:hypothetical protein
LLYFVQFRWVFNRLHRPTTVKRVVGVFVRFRAPLHMTNSSMTFYAYIEYNKIEVSFFQDLHIIAEFSLGIVIDTAQYRKSIMSF